MVAAHKAGQRGEGVGGREPSSWVMRYLHGVKPGGLVADVACGSGRHLRAALARGYRGIGLDRDLTGVADLANFDRAELIETDLEAGGPMPLQGRSLDGIIVTNYLWRPLLATIAACLATDGVLIYETFAVGHARLGGRPSNPDFLLKPNELIDRFSGELIVIAFEQAHLGDGRERIVQRIVAVGPAHRWVTGPPRSSTD